ncbi:MAG: ABC transporter substrate-binding protein [Oceanibaculum nanhaiense]|uniref:ABC transporter substrate-binding protein n=1 Tax=Oceanibaculum nanhaiense TaxID=1909734 RepID=UPI0025A4A12D|nr:ABC transporter substrate-binding protein [Oceanibaculum nanhaiense]MDM7945168.1 ABC transporter substrate-binding protein [Oceanibaculum nanhaiense]
MMTRRNFAGLALAAGMTAALMAGGAANGPAVAADKIILGDMNSYTGFASFTIPYKQGWELALEEINASGGILGKQVTVVSRDDGAKPADAVTVANELVSREGATLLFGTLLSHVGLAVSDFAKQKKVIFIAAEPLSDAIAWQKGNRYTFRLRPGTYVQAAMLAEEAAKLPAKKWATIAPNYEYGQSAVAAFKELLKAKKPDVEFVAEQWPALGKIDAGAAVQALAAANPDAIFNVTFGGDLLKFVREGKVRGLWEKRTVASMLSGEPDWIDPMKDEAPEGWLVTGYPWYAIDTPEHNKFREAFQKKFNDYPRLGSVVGYAALYSVKAAMEKAGTTETEKLVDAFADLTLGTPVGPITYRAIDNQTTMGAYVGTLTVKDGMPRMVDWRFGKGEDYLPPDDVVMKLRAKE